MKKENSPFRRNARRLIACALFIVCLGLLTLFWYTKPHEPEAFSLNHRPGSGGYLYDHAGILEDVEEYAVNYLHRISENNHMGAVIVTIPALEKRMTIEEQAVAIMNNWRIGEKYHGRGVLLLFAEKEKQVKLEVSYDLEDVFTDLFCGYIEDIQLKPYFLAQQTGIGLLAVMEEIEQRAQIKDRGQYTTDWIAQIDMKLLSGGAGAKKDLTQLKKEETASVDASAYPPGETPEAAWQTLLRSWREKARGPLGVYTNAGNLIRRDFQNMPNARLEEFFRSYAEKPYEVIEDGHYAVISFGNQEGWKNSPFLFCKTSEGWKYDLVHQRRYVRMGPKPVWGVERSNHPYVELLGYCSYWTKQDIPLEGEDIYRIEEDARLAREILRVECEYKESPSKFQAVMNLGRLYTIIQMGPKTTRLLKKAKQLDPASPLPNKYLGIIYLSSNYQLSEATAEMEEYIRKKPQDSFGFNYLGHLYLCTQRYGEAIPQFEKAIELRPDNCYAYCKLSRCYGYLYMNASPVNLLRESYRKSALAMFSRARFCPTPDERRIEWLYSWLKANKVLADDQ